MDIYTIVSIISLIIAVAAVVGTIIAYIRSTGGQIQERAINALEKELVVLRGRLDDMEMENRRLDQIIQTICDALGKRGLDVSVDGSIVTIQDGNVTQSVRIQGT